MKRPIGTASRLSVLCLLAVLAVGLPAGVAEERPNVLFLAVDDLRPALRCYGDPTAVTPNIDRLAARGLLFDRAYCQQAICNPSRASLITGRRPDTIRVWDLKAHFRDAMPDVITLPQHFKNHGYVTESIGKILHGSGRPAKDPPSWSVPATFDLANKIEDYLTDRNLSMNGTKRGATDDADVDDDAYRGGKVTHAAVLAMRRLRDKPFFLAIGYRKPHLPFSAPKKYWDLYDREKIPPPATSTHPNEAPELAVRSFKELEGYQDVPDEATIPLEKVRELRHGYYACVSFTDAQIGRLLDELEALNLANKTVVVLWGDHGFHLGEQGLWAKAYNYELTTRVPLILAVPGQKNVGQRTGALVEFVDVYPTLVDLCGLPMPGGLEGMSMKPLLDNPRRPWKKAAFSQFPRAKAGPRHRGRGHTMGYALRTDQYRYVEWRTCKTGDVVARELYDHESEPREMRNLADRLEHAPLVRRLSEQLHAGWRAARPTE